MQKIYFVFAVFVGLLAGCANDPPTPAVWYRCADGQEVSAFYDGEAARIAFAGQSYAMQTARSGSGARYVGGGHQWWTKGREGTLSRLEPESVLAADCVAQN